MNLIYWSVCLSSRREGLVRGGFVILTSWEYYFIRVYKNLVQNPSNYKSIEPYKISKDNVVTVSKIKLIS